MSILWRSYLIVRLFQTCHSKLEPKQKTHAGGSGQRIGVTKSMTGTPYTTADLDAARADLKRWSEAFANDSSNNPNKYQSEIRRARMRIRATEAALKASGALPMTEHELLEVELNRLYQNAPSKTVVEHQGKKYRRWYYPAERSNNGKTVPVWDSGWEELKPATAAGGTDHPVPPTAA